MTIRRLTRSRNEGKVAGVCAGIANYFDVDVVLVRGNHDERAGDPPPAWGVRVVAEPHPLPP